MKEYRRHNAPNFRSAVRKFDVFPDEIKDAVRRRQGGKDPITGDGIQEFEHLDSKKCFRAHENPHDSRNCVGVSRVGHALRHLAKARLTGDPEETAAVGAIVDRMTREERRRWNKMKDDQDLLERCQTEYEARMSGKDGIWPERKGRVTFID